jgi:hypothetical protein
VYKNNPFYLHQVLEQDTHNESNANPRAANVALGLFRKARFSGKWARLRSVLERSPNALIDLNNLVKDLERQNRHYAGIEANDAVVTVWDIERRIPVMNKTSKDLRQVSHATTQ